MAGMSARKFLLLAQLPPPVHGVTAMTQRFGNLVAARAGWTVEHLWLGGSKGLTDVNRRTARKYLEFASLLLRLVVRRVTGPHADVSYVTLAPWTHAALRDVLLAGAAKGVSSRTLVHLHGEGLDALLQSASLKGQFCRNMLKDTELITCTSAAREIGARSGLFRHVRLLANAVGDPEPVLDQVARRTLGVGYLANLDPRKGVHRFVDGIAAAHASGVDLSAAIAGPSTPFLRRDEVEASINQRGLTGVVSVQDALYGADKDAFFRGLDVLLYPSLHDHAPLVVIEALSYGVVPIVMDTGGVREMLGPALSQNVFDARGRPEDFADFVTRRLKAYASDARCLAADRTAARARYLETYTEARFCARCGEILEGAAVIARSTVQAT